jgi:hypothetical protein
VSFGGSTSGHEASLPGERPVVQALLYNSVEPAGALPTHCGDEVVRDEGRVVAQYVERDGREVLLPVEQRGAAELQDPGRAAEEEEMEVGATVAVLGELDATDAGQGLDRGRDGDDPGDPSPRPAGRGRSGDRNARWDRG